MKGVIILTELYYPEQTSTGYFLTKIAEELAQEYHVKVITGPATKLLTACQDYPTHEIKNNVEIWRCQGTSFNQIYLFGRCLNIITRSIFIFCKTLFTCQRNDIILVVTNPPLLPFTALLIKWIKGIKLVLLIHDVYPEALVAMGLLKSTSFVMKISHLVNTYLYQEVDKIITLGRDMIKLVKARLSYAQDHKIICISHWADIELIQPTKKAQNTLLKSLDILNKFVILYAGNMGRTHGVEYVAEAAKILKKNKTIHFILSGFGSKKNWLENYVVNHQLKNITLLNPCPSSELNILLNACDTAIIPFVPGMAGISVPSRMYNHMAAGKPIIAVADDWSELAEVIREKKIGWVVEPGNITDLIDTIELASASPQLCLQMGIRAAEVAQTKYTLQQVNMAYKKLFKDLFLSDE